MKFYDHEKIIVSSRATLKDAIEIINSFPSLRTVFVVDDKNFLGLLTEGDIRRSLLKGETITSSVMKALNKNPRIYSKSLQVAPKEIYPIIEEGKLCGYFNQDFKVDFDKFWVLVMAGGYGTRLKPYTDKMPKPMLEIAGKPMLELIINEIKHYGFKNFYISTHYKQDAIRNHFGSGKNLNINIQYIHEDEPLGTAGCITRIENCSNLLITNGDVISKINYLDLLKHHINESHDVTVCVRDYMQEVPFGVVYGDEYVDRISEKPKNQYLINSGMYVLSKPIVETLAKLNAPFDMPEKINELIDQNKVVGKYHFNNFWMDIGNPDDLIKMREIYVE
jgi:dTDP-glucose pyrophosphorylase